MFCARSGRTARAAKLFSPAHGRPMNTNNPPGPGHTLHVAARAVIICWLLLSCLSSLGAPVTGITQNGLEEISALLEEKASWSPAQTKMESQLIHALKSNRGQAFATKAKSLQRNVPLQADGRVLVDIKANVTPDLLSLIAQGGGHVINSFPQFRAIRALVTLGQLETLAGSA